MPSGASIAQYYTLSALRVADRLAAASNSLDDGMTDWEQGRINDAYLSLIAQRSAETAHSALSDARDLTPPSTMQQEGADFFFAAAAMTTAVDAAGQALSAPPVSRAASLKQATQQRRAAAEALTSSLNVLLAASWGPGVVAK